MLYNSKGGNNMIETEISQMDIPVYIEEENVHTKDTHANYAHWHNGVEIIVVQKGTFGCCVDGNGFELQKGDICFINQKQLHYLCDFDDKDSKHKVLIIGNNMLTQNPVIYENCIRPIIEDQEFAHIQFVGDGSNAAKLSEKIDAIESCMQKKELGYELEVVALVHQVFALLYRAYHGEDVEKQEVDSNLYIQQKMNAFIHDNYMNVITLDDIASSGGVSRSQCIKLFKQYTNQPPIGYLNLYRLERSRELLRNTSDSIASIASQCSFSEQSYYNRLFLREYGITPLEYRKGIIHS